jgi:hypothetical protein
MYLNSDPYERYAWEKKFSFGNVFVDGKRLWFKHYYERKCIHKYMVYADRGRFKTIERTTNFFEVMKSI